MDRKAVSPNWFPQSVPMLQHGIPNCNSKLDHLPSPSMSVPPGASLALKNRRAILVTFISGAQPATFAKQFHPGDLSRENWRRKHLLKFKTVNEVRQQLVHGHWNATAFTISRLGLERGSSICQSN